MKKTASNSILGGAIIVLILSIVAGIVFLSMHTVPATRLIEKEIVIQGK
jgi:hypothetical protein